MPVAHARSVRPLILVVDDDDITRKVIRVILRTQGFRVFLSATWRDAIRICVRFGSRIDLVISEVQMPEMSGMELAEHVRHFLPDVPVLLMSGSYFRQDMVVLNPIGPVAAFLAKPFTQRVFLKKVQVLMPGGGRGMVRSSYGVN
jgi:two-component system, chemotaxis family, chemotaxis protein CheY